jgi:hypothetical protein
MHDEVCHFMREVYPMVEKGANDTKGTRWANDGCRFTYTVGPTGDGATTGIGYVPLAFELPPT